MINCIEVEKSKLFGIVYNTDEYSSLVTKEILKESKVTAEIIKFENNSKPFYTLLYALLPKYLNYKYGIKYNDSYESLINKKSVIKDLIQETISFLETEEVHNSVIERILRSIPLNLNNPEKLSILIERLVIRLKKVGLSKRLEGKEKSIFSKFTKIYKDTNKELDIKSLDFLFRFVLSIDRPFIKLLKSLKYTKEKKDYYELKRKLISKNKELFKTSSPTTEDLLNLKEKNKKKFKEWSKLNNEVKKSAKRLLEEEWVNRGWDVVDVKEAEKLLKYLGIESPIPKNFVGKVGIREESPSSFFKYYTTEGKELAGIPTKNVIMNPNYDPKKDNTYYLTFIPETGNKTPQVMYTVDWKRDASDEKFLNTVQATEKLERVRSKIIRLMHSDNEKIRKTATIIRLAELTNGRIGNKASEEKRGVYGLHNLKGRHVKIKEGKAIISYKGKKGMPQRFVVTDPEMVKILRKYKKEAGRNGYIFGYGKKGKPVSNGMVNKMLKKLGLDTSHFFRRLNVSKRFEKFIQESKNKKWDKEKVVKEFKKAIEECAKVLQDTKGMVLRHYLNPDLVLKFFSLHNVRIPKSIKKQLSHTKAGKVLY